MHLCYLWLQHRCSSALFLAIMHAWWRTAIGCRPDTADAEHDIMLASAKFLVIFINASSSSSSSSYLFAIKSQHKSKNSKYTWHAAIEAKRPWPPMFTLLVGAVVRLVEYWTHNREVAGLTHTRSTASNLEQVTNLLCAQANSASYPQCDGKWVVATATEWSSSVADWGDGVSASCTMGQLSVSAGSGWPHNALRHHWLMPISCHLRDCKALLVTSLTHVSGAIASVQTFTFTSRSTVYTNMNDVKMCESLIKWWVCVCDCRGLRVYQRDWYHNVTGVVSRLTVSQPGLLQLAPRPSASFHDLTTTWLDLSV